MLTSYKRALLIPIILCLVALGAGAPMPDVQYKTVTKVNIGGAAGKALNFLAKLGGGSTESTETVYLKGNKMLTQGDDMGTLIDLDARRMVTIDHKKKTYSSITFEEFMQKMEEMVEEGKQAMDDAKAEAEEAEEADNQDTDATGGTDATSETKMTFDVSVDPTGKTSTIAGNAAKNYLMTLTMLTETTVEEDGQEETYEGTLVVASDLWMSTSVQGHDEIEAFNRRFAEEFGAAMTESATTMAEGMQQAFAGDPRMKEGMEQAQEEAAKLEGVEVKNTTYMVLVAADATFNPDLLFAEKKEEKKEKKSGGLFGRIARQVAGADQPKEEENQEMATQQVLLSVTTEMQDYSTSVPESVFEIPSDYKQVAYGSF